jgi:phospholipase C
MMEKWLTHKTGKKIEESNITAWRRTICGDLSSVFRPYNEERIPAPKPLVKRQVIEDIHRAKTQQLPSGFRQLTKEDIERVRKEPSMLMPEQERGTRLSCGLPYELYAEGDVDLVKGVFSVNLRADKLVFGARAMGSPFTVYSYGSAFAVRNYAVAAGDQLTDDIPFTDDKYDMRVYGPNGFYRRFAGSKNDPPMVFNMDYEFGGNQQLTGRLLLRVLNTDGSRSYKIHVKDNAYGAKQLTKEVVAGGRDEGNITVRLDISAGSGWYDHTITVEGFEGYERRYAGRIETGKDGISDPAMG